jgi:nicotinamide mononucleotide (NMN) deamidase PncC
VYSTGGGSQLAPYLLSTPGASRTVLEYKVPYSRHSLTDLLGYEPTHFTSAAVAREMSEAAFERARELMKDCAIEEAAVGLGCTAALRSEPEKRGEHRCYIAVRTQAGLHELALTLAKGARSREAEDAVVSRVALFALAHACGVTGLPHPKEASSFWQLEEADEQSSQKTAISAEQLEYSFHTTLDL